MAYHINIHLNAQQELEQAALYYCTFRKRKPIQFIANLESAFTQLTLNPFKPLRYKSARAIRLEEFPFALYYTVHEQEKQVIIHSCLQDLRNPRRKKLKALGKTHAMVPPDKAFIFDTPAPFAIPKIRERKTLRAISRRSSEVCRGNTLAASAEYTGNAGIS